MIGTAEHGLKAGDAVLSEGKPKAPEKPNRNSDVRKEQNRVASRNYRAKRKQKLALLDQFLNHAEPGTPAEPNPQSKEKKIDPDQAPRNKPRSSGLCRGVEPAVPTEASPRTTQGNLDTAYDGLSIPPTLQGDFSSMNSSLAHAVTNHGWDPTPEFDPSGIQEFFASSELFAPDVQPPPGPPDGIMEGSWYTGNMPSPQKPIMPGPDLATGGAMMPYTPAKPEYEPSSAAATSGSDADLLPILEGLQNLSVTQKRELISVLERQTAASSNINSATAAHPNSQPFPSSSSSSKYPPNLTATYNWVSTGPRIGQPRVRIQREARRFADFIDRVGSGQLSPTQLSRVYAAEAGFYGAIFANCFALGMSQVEPMLEENGVSPFCIGTDTGYDPAMIGFVRRRFDGITPDLRPVDQQMIFGHHPYLDVLPFKSFRDKALKALEHDPEAFDEEELCQDLSLGLVCWGAHGNSLGMDAGVPWDARSWEPKVWFMQKYWFLVGGWDEELWVSVRRWHALRGEKIRYDEGQ